MDCALLRDLSEAVGVPGAEEAVRLLVRQRVEPLVDAVRTDAMGNLIVRKGSGPLRILLDAHLDEVGARVSTFDDDGNLRFKVAGGVDPRMWAGRHVWVGSQRLPGVIGVQAYHLVADSRDKAVPERDLYIDIGRQSRAEALAAVDYGDAVVWATPFAIWSERIVKGKALDDRAGCAALIELLQDPVPPAISLYGVFSVQEEIGTRGAGTAAFSVAPHVAIALEVTAAADVPGIEGATGRSVVMGAGPVLYWMDGTIVVSERLDQHLEGLAAAAGIPVQHKRSTRAGTDAGAIHQVCGGVPTAIIAAPARYIHGPAALMDLTDLEGGVALCREFVRSVERGDYRP